MARSDRTPGRTPHRRPGRKSSEASSDRIVFRDSFLFYFSPEAREKLQQAGTALFHQVLSGDQPRRDEPPLLVERHARLRDVVRDLRFAVQLLGEMARERPFDSRLDQEGEDRDENRLARDAGEWAEELERLAARVEAAVDDWPGWEEGGDGGG